MLFGKFINRYYLKYLHLFLFGLVALIAVDYAQLEIPKLYKYLINGINEGVVEINGQMLPFNFDFVLDSNLFAWCSGLMRGACHARLSA